MGEEIRTMAGVDEVRMKSRTSTDVPTPTLAPRLALSYSFLQQEKGKNDV